METVKFSYNWNNKLNCKAFTTLRLHNPRKYIPGVQYLITDGKHQFVAVLKTLRTFGINHLNDFVCHIDTGYDRQQTISILRRMYPKMDLDTTLFDYCLFVKVESPKARQNELQFTD